MLHPEHTQEQKQTCVEDTCLCYSTGAEAAVTGEGAAAALRARAESEARTAVASQNGAHDVLWRVNLEEFNRRFRCVRRTHTHTHTHTHNNAYTHPYAEAKLLPRAHLCAISIVHGHSTQAWCVCVCVCLCMRWYVCVCVCVCVCRHALCVDMAREKFDVDVSLVLEAMLAAGRMYERGVSTHTHIHTHMLPVTHTPEHCTERVFTVQTLATCEGNDCLHVCVCVCVCVCVFVCVCAVKGRSWQCVQCRRGSGSPKTHIHGQGEGKGRYGTCRSTCCQGGS